VMMAMVTDTQAPSVPTGVTATAQSSTSILVAWTASTDNVGVTGYKVYRNTAQVGTSATTSYTDTGLTASTTYSYTVSAYDGSSNNSAQSSPLATATTPAQSAATVIYASQDSYTYASAGSTNYDGQGNKMSKTGGNDTEYNPFWLFTCGSGTAQSAKLRVYQTFTNNNGGLTHWVGGTQTFDETTLTLNNRPTSFPTCLSTCYPGGMTVPANSATWYELDITSFYNAHLNSAICITAFVDNNFGSVGMMFEDREGTRGTGNYPRILVCTVSAPTNATAVPSTICGGGSSTLTYSGGSGDVLKWYSGSCGGTYVGSGQSLSVTPGATTTYYCRWEGTSCNPSTCASVTVTVGDAQAPSVPTNVSATAQTQTTVQVTWTVSTDNCALTGYKIFRNTSQVGTSATTSYTDTGLTANTTYSYTVCAYDAASNNSAQSSPPATARTSDETAPSVPAGVSATTQTPGQVKVTWTASTDNVGVTGYKIYRNASQVGTSATTSYTDTGLTPGTTYSYAVSAYDAADNNSAQSSPPVTVATMTAIDIDDAKTLVGTSSVGMVSKKVTAIYSGCLYVEETDRYTGIKVVPIEMPGGLSVGSIVDVGGIIQMENHERYIGGATVIIR